MHLEAIRCISLGYVHQMDIIQTDASVWVNAYADWLNQRIVSKFVALRPPNGSIKSFYLGIFEKKKHLTIFSFFSSFNCFG